MAEAWRFRTVVSGKTLTISDLERFEGRRVEVIALDDEQPDAAVAELARPKPRRRFGTMAGQIRIVADFDASLPDIERAFEQCCGLDDKAQVMRDLPTSGGLAAGPRVTLTVDREQAQILERTLTQLRVESARADAHDFREMLHPRERVVEGLLGRLSQQAG